MEFRMQLQPEEQQDQRQTGFGRPWAPAIGDHEPRFQPTLARQAKPWHSPYAPSNLDVQSITVVGGAQSASSHMDGTFNAMSQAPEQPGNGESGAARKADVQAAETKTTSGKRRPRKVTARIQQAENAAELRLEGERMAIDGFISPITK